MSYTKNKETKDYVLFLTSEFSQWFPSDFVSKEGQKFNSAEQYMMYSKAKLFGDDETAEKILVAETPDQQKKLGRLVKNFDKDVWDAHAQEIVYQGNYYKFTQNPHLWNVLERTTGKELVEAAHYDPIWGIGLKADDPLAADKANWKGKNWLGGALTKLRDDLIAQKFVPPALQPEQIVFNMYDAQGQRNLYITTGELSKQFNMSARQMVDGWEHVHGRDIDFVDIEIKFKGKDEPLKENLLSFLNRNKEEISAFNIMTQHPDLAAKLRKDPQYRKSGF